jgi:hypothetical protein
MSMEPFVKICDLGPRGIYSVEVFAKRNQVMLKSTLLYVTHVNRAFVPGTADTSSGLSMDGGGSEQNNR